MRAEVITLGDELTSGVRLDTNSQWLSQQLEQQGVPVSYHTTVGDQLDSIVATFRAAFSRSDIVVATGGLGPTADDLTREALAESTGCPLDLDASILAHIRDLFASRGRTMPERNTVQAKFPRGSRVITNPHGTAPGIQLQYSRTSRTPCHVFALPGVPAELRQMWTESVVPQLNQILGPDHTVIRHRSICCFGAGESDIEQRLPDLVRRGRVPAVGITASEATITLRVTASAPSPQACQAAMEPTVATIYQCLGDLIYGEGDDKLQDVIVRLLQQQQRTVATIEWGTEGLVAHWLSDAAAGADCYRGGLVVTGEHSLRKLLSLTDTLSHQAMDDISQLVTRMAVEIRDQLAVDYALAVGPRPAQETAGQGPAHIHFALSTPRSTVVNSQVYAAHPSIQRPRSAKHALNLLRLSLLHADDYDFGV